MENDILVGQFDADILAKEFVKTVKKKPEIATDVDAMRGWFANAVMNGYDRGARKKGK